VVRVADRRVELGEEVALRGDLLGERGEPRSQRGDIDHGHYLL
jgi:hypothetical protein